MFTCIIQDKFNFTLINNTSNKTEICYYQFTKFYFPQKLMNEYYNTAYKHILFY